MRNRKLNEQMSRIKSMMKRINENEFDHFDTQITPEELPNPEMEMEDNVDIDFMDETDTAHGTYKFYYTVKDDEGEIVGDYDGTIKMAPKNSRMDDEIEWGTDTPEDWEKAESEITDRFYEWLHSRKKTHKL